MAGSARQAACFFLQPVGDHARHEPIHVHLAESILDSRQMFFIARPSGQLQSRFASFELLRRVVAQLHSWLRFPPGDERLGRGGDADHRRLADPSTPRQEAPSHWLRRDPARPSHRRSFSISFRCSQLCPMERSYANVIRARSWPTPELVFLDQSGMNLSMSRSHPWVTCREKLIDRVPMSWAPTSPC